MSLIATDFPEVQKELTENFYREDPAKVVVPPIPALVGEVKEFNKELLRTVLGESGNKLLSFISTVDLDHPDLSKFLPEEGCRVLSQHLKVVHFVHANSLMLVLPQIRQMATRDMKENLKDVNDPMQTNRLMRLVKDKRIRNTLRQSKIARKIGLESFFKSGSWDNVPDSFKGFARFGNGIKPKSTRQRRKPIVTKNWAAKAWWLRSNAP